LVVEVRLRGRVLDEVLEVSKKLSEALKVPASQPKFSQEHGDFTIWFAAIDGGGE